MILSSHSGRSIERDLYQRSGLIHRAKWHAAHYSQSYSPEPCTGVGYYSAVCRLSTIFQILCKSYHLSNQAVQHRRALASDISVAPSQSASFAQILSMKLQTTANRSSSMFHSMIPRLRLMVSPIWKQRDTLRQSI